MDRAQTFMTKADGFQFANGRTGDLFPVGILRSLRTAPIPAGIKERQS
jgi:hypothetical protein